MKGVQCVDAGSRHGETSRADQQVLCEGSSGIPCPHPTLDSSKTGLHSVCVCILAVYSTCYMYICLTCCCEQAVGVACFVC